MAQRWIDNWDAKTAIPLVADQAVPLDELITGARLLEIQDLLGGDPETWCELTLHNDDGQIEVLWVSGVGVVERDQSGVGSFDWPAGSDISARLTAGALHTLQDSFSVPYKGQFGSYLELKEALPFGQPGNYADVDTGPGEILVRYAWDASDLDWVPVGGASNAPSAPEVKALYESNTDTNAFTDAEKSKLAGIETSATRNDDTDSLAEGVTNLWFTAARVRGAVLTGLSLAADAAISATDSVLTALGKLQAQLNGHFGAGGSSHAEATAGAAGFMSAADKAKLNGIASNATANDTDANLKDRANHAGSQAISTISGLQQALDGVKIQFFTVACSDESTALTAGSNKTRWRMPAFTLTGVRASVSDAQSSGSLLTIDINVNGTSILSTKITIDNTEKTSVTAAIPAVISSAVIPDDAEIAIDLDQIGDGTAKGLKVTLIGYMTP